MTQSCRERLVAAALAALAGIEGVPGLEVELDREHDLDESELPRLILVEGDEIAAGDFTGEEGFTLPVIVEGYVTAATPEAARSALAQLRAKAHQALIGSNLLGGLARDIRLSQDQPAEAGLPLPCEPGAAFARGYDVDYATAEGDPFTFAADQ